MVSSWDPSCWSIGSYVPFLWCSHMQKQYRKRTTLRSESSTITGLLYAPDPEKNVRKGRWVISPNYCMSHPRRFCVVGDVVAQRYDLLWDWLWDACHMAGVRWGSCCEGFCSKDGLHYCLEQSVRNPTINLIHEFGNPFGIPYPSCTV